MGNIAGNYLDALITDLQDKQVSTPALSDFIDVLKEINGAEFISRSGTLEHPIVVEHLQPALDTLGRSNPLANAVSCLAKALHWYQLYEDKSIDPALADGMIAGQFAGKNGLIKSDRLVTGLFLLAPGVHYPLHQHAAQEVYSVVSGTLTLQHGRKGVPFDVPAGECSVTPCNRLHSLTKTSA